jgi:beta-glucanase (GH16 family)
MSFVVINPCIMQVKLMYMKKIAIILITIFFGLQSIGQINDKKWKIVMQDEFDYVADAPNPAVWKEDWGNGCEHGICGWGNGEWQAYDPGQVWVDGEKMVLEAKYIGTPGLYDCGGGQSCQWLSGKVITQGLFEHDYGLFEARIKIPKGEGVWPAFWTLGANQGSVGWPKCGEVDIMEAAGLKPDTIVSTVHWWVYDDGNPDTYSGPANNGWSASGPAKGRGAGCGGACGDEYHVFSVEKTTESMKFYMDGVLFDEFVHSGALGGPEAFNQKQYILINFALAGAFSDVGEPQVSDFTSNGPKQMLVDWVRVYEETTGTDEHIPYDGLITDPPILSGVSVSPASKTIAPGEQLSMTATAVDQYGRAMAGYSVTLEALDGNMTDTVFSSSEEGIFLIRATLQDTLTASAFITVKEAVADGTQIPYNGAPSVIPGTIEAAHFDKLVNETGQGEAYNELGVERYGTVRLEEDVDCFGLSGEGDVIGYIENGEWVEYTVNVEVDGVYDLTVRYTCGQTVAGGRTVFTLGGNQIAVMENVPTTPDWNSWSEVTINNINLSAGEQLLRVDFEEGWYNLGKMIFDKQGATTVTGVEVIPASIKLAEGVELQLEGTVIPSSADNSALSWSSSDPAAVSVSSTGLIKVLQEGSDVMITATSDENTNIFGSALIKLSSGNVPVTSIAIQQQNMTIAEDSIVELSTTLLPVNATNKGVVWASSAPSIVSVTQAGEITAIREGVAKISATADADQSIADEITVTVSNQEGERTIILSQGWNLISFNIDVPTKTPDVVFPNAMMIKDNAGFFSSVVPDYLQSIHALLPGEAYLLYNSVSETIILSGIEYSNTSVSLQKGWNLVGCAAANTVPVTSLPAQVLNVKDFDAYYDRSNATGALIELLPGNGYFIYVSEDVILSW